MKRYLTQKRLLRFSIFLSVLLLMTAFTQAQQPVFRIGIFDAEDGSLTQGARLAMQEINQSGGVIGADGTAFQLELVVHPDENIPLAVANINQASVIAVIGPRTTEQVLGNMADLQNLQVPILTPAIGDSIIVTDDSGFLFRIRTTEILQGRALADYLINERNISQIITAQLDLESTGGAIGFSTALSQQNIDPLASYLLGGETDIEQIASNINQLNPQAVAIYGNPEATSELYRQLINIGWRGIIIYNQAQSDEFQQDFSLRNLAGILGVNTWSFASQNTRSQQFVLDYVQTFADIPDELSAASYDAIYMLAEAIKLPGDLRTNLTDLQNLSIVQGLLDPINLRSGETSTNVVITEITDTGAPEVVAQYRNEAQIEPSEPVIVSVITPIPQPTRAVPTVVVPPTLTPTPSVPMVEIQSRVQNVRTGPSTDYDVIGQVSEGERYEIIGATIDFSWVVINYRGRQGWLAEFLTETSGNLGQVPIISPPPTPTPLPATATPTAQPLADIVITSASPAVLSVGEPFSVAVNVRNQGLASAGSFAIASTFNPGNAYSAVNIPSLGAGQQTTITLSGTLTGSTGPQQVVLVADLNDEVFEGPVGEANNTNFVFAYVVDRRIQNLGQLSLNVGGTLTLEGAGMTDLLWNGSALQTQNGAMMYRLNVSGLNQVHYDLINPANATNNNFPVEQLPNAIIGVITAEGNRGAIQVNSVASGGILTLTYRVYQSP